MIRPPMALVSIKASQDLQRLEIVNQLLLPHVTEYVAINSVEDAHDAIKSMKVAYIAASPHPIANRSNRFGALPPLHRWPLFLWHN
jgi:hypothetical protein